MEKSLIPNVQNSIPTPIRDQITLKQRLEIPNWVKIRARKEPFLLTPSETEGNYNSDKENIQIRKEKPNCRKSSKQYTQVDEDPSICNLILDSNREVPFESKSEVQENLQKHLYEKEKSMKDLKTTIHGKNDSGPLKEIQENSYKTNTHTQDRSISLSNMHYKTRQQLQDFRDKYFRNQYSDDLSSWTELSAQNTADQLSNLPKENPKSEVEVAKENPKNDQERENTFGPLKEYNSLDVPQNGKIIAVMM